MTLAIEAKGLVKRYNDDVLAVDGVDLAIPVQTVYALLGPNGAGKTTTISILTTLLQPTTGWARVMGQDVVEQAAETRRRIGVTFQETVLDDELSGRQVLDYHGRLYGMTKSHRQTRIQELLALVELEDAADRAASTYSGGMKRRLELARGLMTRPDVLFLDEPTLGLDPQNRASIWDYISRLQRETGLTLLLTTHYMEEAEAIADCVGIIDRGRIMIEGSPRTLIEQIGADTISLSCRGDCTQFVESIRDLPFVQAVHIGGSVVQVGVDSGNKRLVAILNAAQNAGLEIEEVSIAKPSLGDVFLKHTGRQLRDK
jgi:ABC-2 type transport system ATP-binding protein